MRKIFFAGFSLLCLTMSATLLAEEEIEVSLKRAAELTFPTEIGKYYTVQNSTDMVNWFTAQIVEGDDEDYSTVQRFSNGQFFSRIFVSNTPPAAAALSDLTGKTLFLEKLVFNFPDPPANEVIEESAFFSRTTGQTVPLGGEPSVSYTYSLFMSAYNSSSLTRTLPVGVVEQLFLTYTAAGEGRFFRITQVNGVESETDFGDFRVEDTLP